MGRLMAEATSVREAFLSRQEGKRFELLPEGKPTERIFSGWSENHIALSEKNFEAFPGQEFLRGKTVSGIYRYVPGASREPPPEQVS